jgi:HSP20 family protein
MAIQDFQMFGGDALQALRNDMDRFLSQITGLSLGRPSGAHAASLTPVAEITEDDTAYRIITELPGIDQKDVEINLVGSTLSISAERRSEQEQKGRNYLLRERNFGTVRREFRLPDDVDRNRIAGECRNGVLTLTLPKSQESRDQRRRIEIKNS